MKAPLALEVRVARAVRPLTDAWQHTPVAPRGTTLLGISFRPPQVETFGLDGPATLRTLLAYPFQLIRLGAYWNRIKPTPAEFLPEMLDWQIDAAEQAGKRIILCVGAVKTFGYPECFVPTHQLQPPLREGTLVTPATHPALLAAASDFVARMVERYRERRAIVAWQVEHEAVDPLGVEHSWRLSTDFVRAEVDAVRAADATRPIMLNGFLPTSLPVRLQQGWRTRDQGDSLAVAQQLADIVGIDYYPRHALARLGARTVYLDGSQSATQRPRRERLCAWASATGHRIMVSEGQAEPWEAVTIPPNPASGAMYSCAPEHVIANYNHCMAWEACGAGGLYAYLFWGAEYWMMRNAVGDARYLQAFARVLDHA